MKNTLISIRSACRAIGILNAPYLALAMAALGVFLSISVIARPAFAEDQQAKAASAEQSAPAQAEEDEKKEYLAIQQVTDAVDRASLLLAFSQKYPESPLLKPSDWENIKKFEAEYSAYYLITRETDFDYRAGMMIDFLQQHPKSILLEEIQPEYAKMLAESSKEKKYPLLESLADEWLKIHPNDKDTYEYLAEATCSVGKYEKCGRCLEEIYKIQPLPSLVQRIYDCYQKTGNLAKQIEWAENLYKIQPLPTLAREIYEDYQKAGDPAKQDEWAERLIQMPEFNDDYMLRYLLVINNLSAKNFHKASEYAQLTLKSLDSAKQPDAKTRTEMQQVRLGCYQVIANDLIEKGQCADAIPAFKKAMEIERSGGYYYDIGLCFDKQKQIDEAMLYYATTELMGGQYAPKAKARLEMLYKALHNDTLVGIDKVYKHAKEQMEN